ncbi:hypothetical protein K493DRAFT_363489 [Basidiobolus meristosporus CBS 931.73]|uniref:Uncharacterized protein n=1 Tax=Basidiobolus meristosporus CBS 931.73 TaxID=1314790 RepID=A0A1Y1WU76_9FUNG|nr:hypothetical protein K493DRAFT_363489 [Basidiobolus meristosporus CBS 931.73]|eukprot:ORX77100.1 hypothetical protein K493DRAFT_363489 [Basidiobolus meristosporus CBS 931.73]
MLKRAWFQGIQDERDYHGYPEFKLRGNPWLGQGEEAVYSRVLMVGILRLMEQHGWRHLTSIDISKKSCDKDSLFFEFTGIVCNPTIFSISLNQTDRLRIIEAPSDVPKLVRSIIQGLWKIQDERNYNTAFEFKLLGNPWMAQGSDTVQIRVLLMRLISGLRSAGYRLYATVDMNAGNDGYDLDSWFFRREDS